MRSFVRLGVDHRPCRRHHSIGHRPDRLGRAPSNAARRDRRGRAAGMPFPRRHAGSPHVQRGRLLQWPDRRPAIPRRDDSCGLLLCRAPRVPHHRVVAAIVEEIEPIYPLVKGSISGRWPSTSSSTSGPATCYRKFCLASSASDLTLPFSPSHKVSPSLFEFARSRLLILLLRTTPDGVSRKYPS